ncbi:MAG: hypothetical protein FLDDKLPJ_02757 [Phycisphaerae bacterium]|nr:hypothetical protein [Phycisphaerae bacterium]
MSVRFNLRSRRLRRSVEILVFGWMAPCLTPAPVRGDELHLSAGVIEGKIISDADNAFRVESFAGRIDVPAIVVRRRVTAPARVDEYTALLSARELDADRHIGLARWGLDRSLVKLAGAHVSDALRLEPTHAEARVLAGYVRLGEVWFRAGAAPGESGDDAREQALVEEVRAGWQRRIHGLRDAFLGAADGARSFEEGHAQLLRIESPLAIDGACVLLGEGPPRHRELLTAFLGKHRHDGAAANLVVLVLTDPDAGVRLAAGERLAGRRDPRVTEVLRSALRCEADDVVRRAAVALGRIADETAFDDLVAALRTDAFADERRTLAGVIRQLGETLNDPVRSAVNDRVIQTPPKIAFPGLARRVDLIDASASPPKAQNRSEAQEALIALTGVNHGFDAVAWRAWRETRRNAAAEP